MRAAYLTVFVVLYCISSSSMGTLVIRIIGLHKKNIIRVTTGLNIKYFCKLLFAAGYERFSF